MRRFILIVFFRIFFSLIVRLVGWRLAFKRGGSRWQASPYECGFIPRNRARVPFALPFYLVALIFIIFDVELIVLFPFLLLNECVSSIEIFIFIFFLVVLTGGLLVEWETGGLEWAE